MTDSNFEIIRTQLQWATSRRAAVQTILCELHCFDLEHEDFHDVDDDDFWHQFSRMVAIAFSLWRSCFLTENLVSTGKIKERRKAFGHHRRAFSGKLVKVNAINFSDDLALNEYSVEYYNHNARYRLERMYMFEADNYKDVIALRKVYKLHEIMVDEIYSQTELWDLYFDALKAAWIRFQYLWDVRLEI